MHTKLLVYVSRCIVSLSSCPETSPKIGKSIASTGVAWSRYEYKSY